MIQQFAPLEQKSDVETSKVVMPGSADFVRQLSILLHCISMHAVETDVPRCSQFQREIRGLAETLRENVSVSDLEAAIGKIVRAVEQYNRESSDSFKKQRNELRDLLGLMAETVTFITSGSESTSRQLGLAASKLKEAAQLKDPAQMRTFMEESLTLVVAESKRVLAEARAKTQALHAEVDRLKGLLMSAKLVAFDDQITGLPARTAAERAMEEGIQAGKEFGIALFIIDRLVSINGRFGRLVGDQVLVNAAVILAQRLRGAVLYRWSGPSFLAIFDASIPINIAEANAKQASALRIEKEFQIRDRNALVVITCSPQFIRVAPNADASLIAGLLDASLVAPELDGK